MKPMIVEAPPHLESRYVGDVAPLLMLVPRPVQSPSSLVPLVEVWLVERRTTLRARWHTKKGVVVRELASHREMTGGKYSRNAAAEYSDFAECFESFGARR